MGEQEAGPTMRLGMLLLLIPLLGGCDQIDKYISTVASKDKTGREHALEVRLDQLDAKLKDQSSEIADLKAEISSLKASSQYHDILIENIDQSAADISEGGGYGIAKTRQGAFLVSMEKIEPYLDGYRATLSVGNTTGLLLHGGDIQVSWGLPWDAKDRTYAQITASRRTKKFSVVKDFQPGAYTYVDVALTPAKPDEVKKLSVGITWNRISLRRPSAN